MRELFEYTDHRELLSDYYKHRKATEHRFSYRKFAAEAGFVSPVFIKMVIDGKSKLSLKSISSLAAVMGFKKERRKFFKALVLFNQSENMDEKMKYLSAMKEFSSSSRVEQISNDKIEFFAAWYHPVVRELISIFDGKVSEKEIAKLVYPEISENEVAESINLMLRLGVLKKDKNGNLISDNTVITSEGLNIGKLIIRATQCRLAMLGADAIEKIPKEERDISGLTISISEKDFSLVSDEIKKLRRKIIEISDSRQKHERVYRLNCQFFPLSLKPGKEG